MILKTCFCGKTKMNFKTDIGPHFYADCCMEAGYDHFGNRLVIENNTFTVDLAEKEETRATEYDTLEKEDLRKLLDLQGISHTKNHTKAQLIYKLNRYGKKTE